jgi:hypothetical protein
MANRAGRIRRSCAATELACAGATLSDAVISIIPASDIISANFIIENMLNLAISIQLSALS